MHGLPYPRQVCADDIGIGDLSSARHVDRFISDEGGVNVSRNVIDTVWSHSCPDCTVLFEGVIDEVGPDSAITVEYICDGDVYVFLPRTDSQLHDGHVDIEFV